MSNLRHRRSLFAFFRLSFFLNVGLSLVVLFLVYYHRKYISDLKSAVTILTVYNSSLQNDLNRSIHYITNQYFSAASAFASNVLSSSVSVPFDLHMLTNATGAVVSTNSFDDLPPLQFNHYFEVDGFPYIKVRNKYFREGDFLLGFPIEEISPDVVKYRGKFFKVDLEGVK